MNHYEYCLDPEYLLHLYDQIPDFSYCVGGLGLLDKIVAQWLEHIGARTIVRYEGKLYRAFFTPKAASYLIMDHCTRASKTTLTYHPYANTINAWDRGAVKKLFRVHLEEVPAAHVMALKLEGSMFEVADLNKTMAKRFIKELANV